MRYLEDVVAANRSFDFNAESIAPPLSGAGFKAAFHAVAAEEIPYHPKPYVNDYVPEPAWEMISSWDRRKLFQLPPCLTRTASLAAFRSVATQLQPSADAASCLPSPRSFLALHVRRGDKAKWIEKDVALAASGRASAQAMHTGTR